MKASGQETDLQDKVRKLEKTEKRCAHLDQKLETTIRQKHPASVIQMSLSISVFSKLKR